MTDLSLTIAPKSDQLNADDMIGGPRTITVTRVTASPDSPEQPVAIYFQGDQGKPYKPCKSMRRVMVSIWGADGAQYVGRSMTLYRDAKVAFGGMQVGGIRISHMTHMDSDTTMALTVTKAKRAPYTVKRLVMQSQPAPVAEMPPMTAADALALAHAQAAKGTDAFRAWYTTDEGKAARATQALTPQVMLECKAAATAADQQDADPFGLPPTDATRAPTATDAEIAAQVMAELAARDAELEGRG